MRGLFHFRDALSCATVLFLRKEHHYFGSALRRCSLASSKAVVSCSRSIFAEQLKDVPLEDGVVLDERYAATDTDVFVAFVREVLTPALRPGQVVVMDNLASHHVQKVQRLIATQVKCRLWYLPPHSPDYSLIEPMGSKRKQDIRSRDP